MKKNDNSDFNNVNENRKKMTAELKNMFSNIKDYFKSNGSFAGVNKNSPISGSSLLAIKDIDTLFKGMMKELIELEKSGASNTKISEQINQSNLSDSEKQMINDIAHTKDGNK